MLHSNNILAVNVRCLCSVSLPHGALGWSVIVLFHGDILACKLLLCLCLTSHQQLRSYGDGAKA